MSESEENDEEQPSTSTLEVEDNLMPHYKTFADYTKAGYKTLMEATRNVNGMPTGNDWNFHRTNKSFEENTSAGSDKIQTLFNSILRNYSVDGNIRHRSIEEKTELLIEANDMILERATLNLDELNGIKKSGNEPVMIQTVSANLPVNGSWNRMKNATFSVGSSINQLGTEPQDRSIRLLTGKNIVRPQKFFKDKINNSSSYPFEPRIKDKPNSLKPLAIFLEVTENGEEYSHPYECELSRFEPSSTQLQLESLSPPRPLKETPLIEVETEEQLNELVETLRDCSEFAVDLEHHSYRSFMGITCLMQISTHDKDYLIDTLKLRDKLHLLNEAFTKPSIVKIFHGADQDVQWLQRDLSIYVVNMFDTHQAAKTLEYSGLSLAYLMNRFCNLTPNKKFQLADWRIRPLPEELKGYAREDTHYLIYIYKNMKQELLKMANNKDNLLRAVIQKSNEVCKKRYFKPVLRDDSHLDFYRKSKRLFDNRQLFALKGLYRWRDHLSREEDESTGYVLPNHMLLQIAESIPREMQGILACCNPIPPLVRANLLELHKIILEAREQSIEKPILKEDTRARGSTKKICKINVDSFLFCPHDLSKNQEFRDDLPTLLSAPSTALPNETTLEIERNSSAYSIFDTPDNSDDDQRAKQSKVHSFTFLSPFERYKMVKPFIQAEEERLAAAEAQSKSRQADRTDEDRIESIREHFMNLTKQVDKSPECTVTKVSPGKKRKRLAEQPVDFVIEIDTPPKSLVQQGGTKKRKHDELTPSGGVIEILDDSPEPQKRRKKNRKRKHRPNVMKYAPSDGLLPNPVENPVRLVQARQLWQNLIGQAPAGGVAPPNNLQRDYYDGGHEQEVKQETFKPFDYASVDFRQFQNGGAGGSKPQGFRTQFKAKNKRQGGKGKSMTFQGPYNNRGRGRGK